MRNISIAVATAMVLLAGCSGPAESPTPAATTEALPRNLGPLPPVSRSLDTGKYLANPCELLTQADFDTLGFAGNFQVKPSGRDFTVPFCEVRGGSGGGELDLRLQSDIQPLRVAYEDSSGKYELLDAVDLRGFPGVARALSHRVPGACEVFLATGKEQTLVLAHMPTYSQGGPLGICGRLVTVADSVLRKLGA